MPMDIKNKLKEYARVLRITTKPGKEEFLTTSQITGLGILIIGLIGFIIYTAATLLRA
jgi:protein transport protein SEC61 subunit gamma-like protein